MEVNANLAQDVFKDAGESVIFVMLSLKREDIEKEREIIADMADRMEAIQRSMNIRVAPEKVTILTALSVTACGIVGWVGLVIPHMCRRMVGVDHARLLPAACFMGAIFLALVDICARSLLAAELPIGILTALLGAPFFAFLLKRTREKQGDWSRLR